jgi:hypothetical protein
MVNPLGLVVEVFGNILCTALNANPWAVHMRGESKHGNEEEAEQLQGGCNTVVDEVVDTAENLHQPTPRPW